MELFTREVENVDSVSLMLKLNHCLTLCICICQYMVFVYFQSNDSEVSRVVNNRQFPAYGTSQEL